MYVYLREATCQNSHNNETSSCFILFYFFFLRYRSRKPSQSHDILVKTYIHTHTHDILLRSDSAWPSHYQSNFCYEMELFSSCFVPTFQNTVAFCQTRVFVYYKHERSAFVIDCVRTIGTTRIRERKREYVQELWRLRKRFFFSFFFFIFLWIFNFIYLL